ncbi:VWA domain-containing protein [Streptacidiphilus monticola]|uniref:VWA domain-containing protein n=1 Tax=Streptacidiphilus monticola TaxID=2161674 RepID=A0ABW1G7Z8_9ACTN
MTIFKKAAAGTASLLAALALVGGVPAAAHADGSSAGNSDFPQQAQPRVELVLDVSGSMRAADLGGMTRIAAAQRALGEVVDALPDEDQVGLRTLGATYPGRDKARGCKDSQQVVPVGPLDRTEIKTAVATLRPTGWTPIGLALTKAAADLKAGGDDTATRRIVLITDGEDDCAPPNPCDVARALAAEGTHLTVDTLGLTLDDKVRRQLTCIAEATGGTYTAITSEDQLTKRLTQLVKRKADPLAPPAATTGSADCTNAPTVTPGVWTDREGFQETRWYKVEVSAGQELRAAVSLAVDRQVHPNYAVTLRATSTVGRELARSVGAGTGRSDLVSTGLRTDGSGAGTVCLAVANAFSADAGVRTTPGFPVELSVALVPAAVAPSGFTSGLGTGWVLVGVLAALGLVAGLLIGWLARFRVAIWREP